MKAKIKQRLRRYLKSELLVHILANTIYCIICFVYTIKNIFCKHTFISEHSIGDTKKNINCNITLFRKPDLDLSIIIPVYNGQQFIKECLDSILAQITTFSYEIILMDDGSDDGVYEYLKENEYLNKIIYIRIENSGQGYARNRGLEVSRGNRIMFLDADDKMAEDCIQSLMCYDEDLIQCGFETFGDDNYTVVHKKQLLKNTKDILKLECYSEGYPWGKVYKRLLFENKGFPEKIHFEDNNLTFLVLPQVKSYRYVNKPLIRYRVHAAQETANVNKKQIGLEQIYVVTYLYEEAKEYYKDSKVISEFLDNTVLYNSTTSLYSRIKGCENLFEFAFEYFMIFYNKNFIAYKPKTYKEKQLKKSVINEDLTKFKLVCKYL